MYKVLKRQELLEKGRKELEELIKSARQLKIRELLSSKGGADHPFWVIVSKEISDHVRSWRFIILLGLIALTCMGSLYTSLTSMGEARSEEHTSELQSLMRISYAVFGLEKKTYS